MKIRYGRLRGILSENSCPKRHDSILNAAITTYLLIKSVSRRPISTIPRTAIIFALFNYSRRNIPLRPEFSPDICLIRDLDASWKARGHGPPIIGIVKPINRLPAHWLNDTDATLISRIRFVLIRFDRELPLVSGLLNKQIRGDKAVSSAINANNRRMVIDIVYELW